MLLAAVFTSCGIGGHALLSAQPVAGTDVGAGRVPFLSRDGGTLFFNDAGPNKDIYHAAFVDGLTFQFLGALSSINTLAVDGTPTMDAASTFYYISTAGPRSTSTDTVQRLPESLPATW